MAQIKDPQTMLVLPVEAIVNSESTPGKTYHVHLPYCPCRDFQYRRANKPPEEMFCKHLLAALSAVGGYHAPADEGFVDMDHAITRNLLMAADDLFGLNARQADGLMRAARELGCADLVGTGLQLIYDRKSQHYSVGRR